MRKYFLIAVFIFIAQLVAAQQDTIKKGSVTINVDDKVDEYIAKRKQQNKEDSLTKGYRIQIAITDKRAEAKVAKEKFTNMFPKCPAYLMFDSPHFKVRVGDFKSKIEAQALLFKLIEEYPTLFLVEDKINPPPIAPCY